MSVLSPMTVTPPCPSSASMTTTMNAAIAPSHGPSSTPATTVRFTW